MLANTKFTDAFHQLILSPRIRRFGVCVLVFMCVGFCVCMSVNHIKVDIIAFLGRAYATVENSVNDFRSLFRLFGFFSFLTIFTK